MNEKDEKIVAWMRETFAKVPVLRMLGATPISYDSAAGRAVIEYDAKPEFCNLIGTVQGGMLTSMLDNAMSFAVLGQIYPDHVAPSIEIKTSYLAPAKMGRIIGEGAVVRRGRSIAFYEGKLSDPDGTVIATATGTAQIRSWPAREA